jgi:hypothetical protein
MVSEDFGERLTHLTLLGLVQPTQGREKVDSKVVFHCQSSNGLPGDRARASSDDVDDFDVAPLLGKVLCNQPAVALVRRFLAAQQTAAVK